MRVIETKKEFRSWRQGRNSVGLVPTMGALHEGHAALIRKCRIESDTCVTSIFVNPTQFSEGEDFDAYPRTWDKDLAILQEIGADAVFAPSQEEMYTDRGTTVNVPDVSAGLEGAHRPGHFDGVATVVSKLFHIVDPDFACFGTKDLQQLAVIRKMVRDLDMRVEVRSLETVRELNGLAMSSRNAYLSESERETASELYKTIQAAAEELAGVEISASEVLLNARKKLEGLGFRVDYLVVVDPDSMKPVLESSPGARIVVAARLGGVRLIDNVPVHT